MATAAQITHSLTISYASSTGQLTAQQIGTGDNTLEVNLTIAASASAAETDMVVVESTLQAFCIIASAAMTVVFKTGTGGSGTTVATFTLVANVPQTWVTGYGTNPFSGNAGQALVTSTPGGILNIRALMQS
jgi:hypothetical protein